MKRQSMVEMPENEVSEKQPADFNSVQQVTFWYVMAVFNDLFLRNSDWHQWINSTRELNILSNAENLKGDNETAKPMEWVQLS